MNKHDSKADTLDHIKNVTKRIIQMTKLLLNRAIYHDETKLKNPEKSYFDGIFKVSKNQIIYESDLVTVKTPADSFFIFQISPTNSELLEAGKYVLFTNKK